MPGDFQAYLRFSRLNAYQACMLMQRPPPYPELLMLQHLSEFGAIPATVKTTIKSDSAPIVTVITISPRTRGVLPIF
ncbi:hypothetical protein K239x_34350 [Planctomycetes bacterium K23_9]|uniref:Uncharacterized protein n=1 Tax=Stieleria marina TaxID=1930275 RepID=A0A517NWF4_9BACT|nr:hypothetical protein K239x_34350 [Planctomycetes bacterium K23_9]